MRATIAVLALALAVTGCASSMTPVGGAPTVVKSYDVGEVQEAGVGESIFSVSSALAVPAFTVTEDYSPGSRLPELLTGQSFHAVGVIDDGLLVVEGGDYNQWLLVTDSAGVVAGILNSGAGMYAPAGEWPDRPVFSPSTSLEGQERAFRAELVYSGIAGDNTVRAMYREFSGDFIRPAFSQELQYNLSQDSTIAYKSIVITVLEADNSRIRYRVDSDGGLEWLPR